MRCFVRCYRVLAPRLMAEQEKAIRADPIGTATAMARRVFELAAK